MAGGGVPIIALTYVLAVVPLLLLCTNPCHKRIPKPVIYLYVAGFVFSALGWECWWTFGWVPPGQDVNHRRCPEDPSSCLSNQLLPPGINWIVTSLYDAGIVCMLGLWLVLQVWKKDVLLAMWNWKVFVVFLVWFVGQNLIVELLISGQISGAEDENEIFVSWAPLSPIGPHWNPSIKVIGEARLSVQNQIPWLLMTPLFYACCIAVYRRQHHQSKDNDDDDDDDDDSKPTEQRMKETVAREEIETAAIAKNHHVDPESNASNGSEHPTAVV